MTPTVPDGYRVPDVYRWFAEETRGVSECYREWADGVAGDALVAGRIDELGGMKRQPQLVFAVARRLGARTGSFAEFRDWLLTNWADVRTEVQSRRTQTNEPRRCAVLLPLLARLPQPIALLEVGASAGLCLLPDRYGYRYNDGDRLDPPDGSSPLLLTCTTNGPVPTRLPEVVWRTGIDAAPLDARSADDAHWLRCLVWPGQDDRLADLDAALRIARADPPTVVRGDLIELLPEVARLAPAGATLVVTQSAVLTTFTDARRAEFADVVRALPARWIAYDGATVLSSGLFGPVPPMERPFTFFVADQGRVVARADGYGRTVDWLD